MIHITSASCGLAVQNVIDVFRGEMLSTVKPLVRGTIAVLQSSVSKPGEHYASTANRVEDLSQQGFSICVPTREQEKKNFMAR